MYGGLFEFLQINEVKSKLTAAHKTSGLEVPITQLQIKPIDKLSLLELYSAAKYRYNFKVNTLFHQVKYAIFLKFE